MLKTNLLPAVVLRLIVGRSQTDSRALSRIAGQNIVVAL
jgi:hypothetical protein